MYAPKNRFLRTDFFVYGVLVFSLGWTDFYLL